MAEEKAERPEKIGPQQDITKAHFDEVIESVEKISSDDLINNPKSAINLLIASFKEKSIECRELQSNIAGLTLENKELSNRLSVANERLGARELLHKVINFVSAVGGILLALASTGKFEMAGKDLSWILRILGLILIFGGPFVYLVGGYKSSQREKEVNE